MYISGATGHEIQMICSTKQQENNIRVKLIANSSCMNKYFCDYLLNYNSSFL
jgi:hypothetical protein